MTLRHDFLQTLFSEMHIEYFGVLPFSECRKGNSRLYEACVQDNAESAVIFLAPYNINEDAPSNVSRYAIPRDYHLFFEEAGAQIGTRLKKELPQAHFRCFSDHSPIDERHAAQSAGLGFIGKNGLLINPEYGSYVFIGEMITDAGCDLYDGAAYTDAGCRMCRKCICACPAAAKAAEEGVLESKEDFFSSPDTKKEYCLSALTQKKGELALWQSEMLRQTDCIWGCDLCQSCCPHNQSASDTPIPFFCHDRIPSVSAKKIEHMPDDLFHTRTYAWRGRRTILRNLSIHSLNEV